MSIITRAEARADRHYEQVINRRRGRSEAERFWEKVDKARECWLWKAAIRRRYGTFYVGSDGQQMIGAHRWAYEDAYGPIPEGLEIDHLCRQVLCVRPSHLEAVTRRTNQLRGNTFGARNIAKIHCPQGHPYDAENTYYLQGRHCKECKRSDALRRYHAQKRLAAL